MYLGVGSTPALTRSTMESPPNFGVVGSGIYRSSYPKQEHFNFLKAQGLKSILLLLPEGYSEENIEFCQQNNIKLFQVGLDGNKEPFVRVKQSDLQKALKIALDPTNHPILIHCNMGKHRTGCVVGCIRRLQSWSLSMIFEEYRRYAFPKPRYFDQLIIETFDAKLGDDETVKQGVEHLWS